MRHQTGKHRSVMLNVATHASFNQDEYYSIALAYPQLIALRPNVATRNNAKPYNRFSITLRGTTRHAQLTS